ncbi:chromosome segregation ATPase [Streptomyces viridosporus ATCC 14672]|uniref:Chromosome segregation ATPase n=1 Tax=Streptomyces viridosporus (strain ATCC 14672 / DSM 40746 / JCM 4963 / KCTC 9882 / NRRL B-12104 / FH 1290) TaxID=566461 RepID=D5ZXJ2_STRV1|nr:caspase family protein [Streptomyces viridosporus]EFE67125.1 chromosome segregation ATPase [Streptomyces viridosporus ATCC 14672]
MAKTALLISCGTYSDSRLQPLPSSIPDGARFADLLERPSLGGFNVHVVNDATLVAAQRKIHDTLSSAAFDDLVLLYLSSHGLKDIFGRFYLALPETDLSALPATALSGRFIREQMNDTVARKLVIILDSCFSGAFGRDLVAKSISLSEGTPDEFTEGTGHAVLAASSPIQYALEDGSGEAPTSVFTRAICDGIATGAADIDSDGWISLNDLFEYSAKEVSFRYPLQTPQMSCFGLDGDIKLLRAPSVPRFNAEWPPDIEEATKSIHTELRIAAAHVLGRIAHSPNTDRAGAALRKLRQLRDDYHPEVREEIEHQIAVAPKKPRRKVPIRTIEDKQVRSPKWVEVPASSLVNASQVAATFVSRDASYEIYSYVHYTFSNEEMKLWATDRYRIDIWRLPILGKGDDFATSLPGDLAFSLKAFNGKKKVRMEVGDTVCEFDCNGKLLSIRSAKFDNLPDYESMMGKDVTTSIHVARIPLLDALERTLAATNARNSPIILDLTGSAGDALELYFEGELFPGESVPVKLAGERVKLAFNANFAIAAVSSFSNGTISISVTNPNKPVLITSDGEPEHRHILMPVRLSK